MQKNCTFVPSVSRYVEDLQYVPWGRKINGEDKLIDYKIQTDN